jgi:Flp pilus assembly protein TadG
VQRCPDRHQLRRRVLTDRGGGLVGTVGAVTVFLGLLGFAVQVLLNLYATSVVTAATYDAARMVARGDAPAAAEAEAFRVLGRYGEHVEFTWQQVDGAAVVLQVQARTPGVLPRAFTEVDRTIHVRRECFRDQQTRCRS